MDLSFQATGNLLVKFWSVLLLVLEYVQNISDQEKNKSFLEMFFFFPEGKCIIKYLEIVKLIP